MLLKSLLLLLLNLIVSMCYRPYKLDSIDTQKGVSTT